MHIKPFDFSKKEDVSFEDDKLDRKKYGEILTQIVSGFPDGFVLALNNEWGTGKTTFLRMWQNHLEGNNYKTIYFNAWENDFDHNPLIALMAELKNVSNETSQESLKLVLEKSAVLLKHLLPAIVKSLFSGIGINTDNLISELAANTAEAASEILEEEVKDYVNKKKGIVEFKNALEEYIKKTCGEKPLVFMIDELDRCRPDYAVEVLENVKHLFSVKGIVFVLSIDKTHLANSIKGFYGSPTINTDEYLRRFIDIEYSLPAPTSNQFVDSLFKYFGFGGYFSSERRSKYREFNKDQEDFLKISYFIIKKDLVTLRQFEKVFSTTKIILGSFKENQYILPAMLLVLIYYKTMRLEIYKKIERGEYSIQELADLFYDTICFSADNDEKFWLIYLQASIVIFYLNDNTNFKGISILDYDENKQPISQITSKLEVPEYSTTLAKTFQGLSYNGTFIRIPLHHLLERINLIHDLQFE